MNSNATGRRPVVLIGRLIADNENLGLGYLKAALEASGREARIIHVNRAGEVGPAVSSIMASGATLVGLSLADGGSAFIPLTLGELLHRRGFEGHITCGGQFATLARSWLLDRYPWLDSVVRLAGEVPLVNLVDHLDRGASVSEVPGVTTRAGDGLPAPVMDTTCTTIEPARGDLPSILGHPAAHITASRGCRGRCAYCGPASIQRLELAEASRAGVPIARARAIGAGGVRRRELDDVCDEMASLWKNRGARYFYFVDEHLLPYRESEALDYIYDWKQGLVERDIGSFGMGMMLRTDRISRPIADGLADLGLVRLFAGLELATQDEARAYGRRAPTDVDLDLLEHFGRLGVATVSNLMLVHPDSTHETVDAGIELLSRLRSGVFEVTRMMVYHGTRLHDRMEREGRLTGNPLRYGYEIDDPAAARFSLIFTRLRGEAFMNYSLAYRTHDVFLSLALARRLHPSRDTAVHGLRMEAIRARVNELYVRAYREALDLARGGHDWSGSDSLVADARGRGTQLMEELVEIEAALMATLARPSRRFSPIGNAAAAVFSFALLGTAAGCHHAGGVGDDAGTADLDTDSDSDSDSDTDTDTECTADETEAQKEALVEEVNDEVPCFEGRVGKWEWEDKFYAHVESWDGSLSSGGNLGPCGEEASELEDEVLEAVDIDDYPCLTEFSATIDGGYGEDEKKMADAINEDCVPPLEYIDQFRILLDDGGIVIDVTHDYGDDPHMDEVVECVMTALTGLEFPCLAGFEVCPEYIIAE